MSIQKIIVVAIVAAGCTEDLSVSNTSERPSFDDFEAATAHEDFDLGVYIVDGDEPVVDIKALEELWEELYDRGELIVNRVGNADDRWNDTQKLALTYCVSDRFGAHKAAVVTALRAATDGGWERAANVDFVYRSDQDAACSATNSHVVFDVSPTSGQPYYARAFFPDEPRSSRNVMVDASSFGDLGDWTLAGILTHELGHALGFRHEHTRPEAGAGRCFEDNRWRALTPYDSASVMHYPECGGTGQPLTISAKDRAGAAALYGAPDGTTPTPPSGSSHTDTVIGAVAADRWSQLPPISVLAGSVLTVAMTGMGDPDLYVRFGAQPTTTRYACRPYLDGAAEDCAIDVPTKATQAYLGVRGYTAATFTVSFSWTGP